MDKSATLSSDKVAQFSYVKCEELIWTSFWDKILGPLHVSPHTPGLCHTGSAPTIYDFYLRSSIEIDAMQKVGQNRFIVDWKSSV